MNQLGFDLEGAQKVEEKPPAEDKKSENSEKEEKKVFSVSELNGQIRQILEGEFPLFWIQGEISNFKAHSSGHFYFSLKDKKSQINAVMFRGFNSKLKFKPESGMEVLVRARVTVYEPRGQYQIFCEVMQPVGAGALQLAFEQLKKKLQAEGLFAPERKRPLPLLPQTIAIVTSPTGAAIRDMIHVLHRRFRGAEVILIPALVQGEAAAPSIVEGIHKAQAYSQNVKKIDVMIVGRGGGSVEDLWAFNEEIVARAVASCSIPVVSAVGHEVDYTIADFVADKRAPTPSAAAEIVVKNAQELQEGLVQSRQRLLQSMRAQWSQKREQLKNLSTRLVDPKRRLQDLSIRCDELVERLKSSVGRNLHFWRQKLQVQEKGLVSPRVLIEKQRQRQSYLYNRMVGEIKKSIQTQQNHWQRLTALLESLSPLKVVERGYAIVRRKEKVIKSIKEAQVGDQLNLQLKDGSLQVEVIKGEGHGV